MRLALLKDLPLGAGGSFMGAGAAGSLPAQTTPGAPGGGGGIVAPQQQIRGATSASTTTGTGQGQ